MPYFFGTQGADVLIGSAQADTLVPNEGADTVNGGGGDDWIELREDGQSDVLTGGTGADLFYFEQGGIAAVFGAYDRITDFSIAEGDRIQFAAQESLGGQSYRRWAGAITDPQFTLTLGAALPAGDPSVSEFWTWQGGGRTYLIIDGGTRGVIDARDFILAFDGLIDLGPQMFTQGTFLAQSGTLGNDVWTGGAEGEVYQGLMGDDVVDGAGGDDDLRGGRGADRLTGGTGDDFLVGHEGDDVLDGGAGDDRLYAGFHLNALTNDTATTNRLFGGDGNDVLVGAFGTDLLDGGTGDDVLDSTDRGWTEDPRDTLLGGAGSDILVMYGDIGDGGDGDDVIRLGRVASEAAGGAGADTFTVTGTQANFATGSFNLIVDFDEAAGDRLDLGGRFARPTVLRGALDNPGFGLNVGDRFSSQDYGAGFIQIWTWAAAGVTHMIVDLDSDGVLGAGDFVLRFSGAPVLTEAAFTPGNVLTLRGATMGADVIFGTTGSDTLYGLGGDDQIFGVDGAYDFLNGGDGADILIAGRAGGTLYGDAGDDRLEGGGTLNGGSGSDLLIGGSGNDFLTGFDARTVAGLDAATDVNLIYGGAGADNITGGQINDRLYGEDGDDSIYGAGYLDGGAGTDSLVSGTGRGYMFGGAGDDFLRGGDFNDFATGGTGTDNLQGGRGDDVLLLEMADSAGQGGFGDDLIIVGGFDEGQVNLLQIYGNEGIDTLDLGAADRRITVDLRSTVEQNIGGGLRLMLGTIENVRAGDFGAHLIGNAAGNRLTGGAGDDILVGGAGDDVLEGGFGTDTAVFAYERGSYTITVRDGLIIVEGPEGLDTLSGIQRLQFSDMTVDGVADLVGAGVTLTGGSGIDVLQGGNFADRLVGGAYNDALAGGGGADILVGGAGDDILIGGSGADTASYGGLARAYAIGRTNGAFTSVTGGTEGGTDSLVSIERLGFLDGYLDTDANGLAAQIHRLYDAALDRGPDQAGLSGWVGRLAGGVTLAEAAQAFATAPEFVARYGNLSNEDFVRTMYRFSLDREGDPAGVQSWTAQMNNGLSRGAILLAFSESAEHRGLTASAVSAGLFVQDDRTMQVARLYDAAFDRGPDQGGIVHWRGTLDTGGSLLQIAAAFVGSQEFQDRYGALTNEDFIRQMYRFTLNREADAAGLQNWTDRLNAGTTRAEMLVIFSESLEHVGLTASSWLNGIPYQGPVETGATAQIVWDKDMDAFVLPDAFAAQPGAADDAPTLPHRPILLLDQVQIGDHDLVDLAGIPGLYELSAAHAQTDWT